MALWVIGADPNAGVRPDWPGCRVINANTKALGYHRYLVEADEAAILPIRAQAGIVMVVPAEDGPYVDDSGRTDRVVNGTLRSP
jgi:hypothetical protein